MIRHLVLALAVTALCLAVPASASLILVSPNEVSGTGLGTVDTILTIQSPANTTTAQGCIGYNGSGTIVTANCFTTGGASSFLDSNVKSGASQTSLIGIGSTGAATAADFTLIYNSSQPAGGAVDLNALTLTIYSPTGSALFSASTTGPIHLTSTFSGTGKSGFEFMLNSTEAGEAAPFWTSSNVLGLGATVLNGSGGLETFYTGSTTGGGITGGSVPEPSTLLLMIAGAGALLWRKRKTARI